MIQNSLYHSALRILSLSLALVLLFDSGLLNPVTAELADNTSNYLANVVGVSVGVVPTELNQLTARITELEYELAVAEEEREIPVNLNQGGSSDQSTFYIAITLAILLLLIILNYAMDFVRSRRLA